MTAPCARCAEDTVDESHKFTTVFQRKPTCRAILYSSKALLSAYGTAQAQTIQRRWRGTRGRLRALNVLLYHLAEELDQKDERITFELASFLSSANLPQRLEYSHSLSRKALSPVIPSGAGHLLPFPLSEGAVISLMRAFEKGERLHADSLRELLRRQAALLRSLPGVVRLELPSDASMCVVGDLHGQVDDLLYILRHRGVPSPTRRFIFNGDLVDRGPNGVAVCALLFAWQQLYPESVTINRGNHEERGMNAVYGFERECKVAYGPLIYESFQSAFEWLPLATVINGKVLVLHGGVDDRLTLPRLADAPREQYIMLPSTKQHPQFPDVAVAHRPPSQRGDWLDQQNAQARAEREARLRPINSVLWNDPMPGKGQVVNVARGTGFSFGRDVVEDFLAHEQLELFIRSHELTQEGYDWPFGKQLPMVTLFSASNYCGRNKNKGAYALITPLRASESPGKAAVPLSFGSLTFVQYEAAELSSLQAEQENLKLLHALIVEYRAELRDAWAAHDRERSGRVSLYLWEKVMKEVLQIKFPVRRVRDKLIGPAAAASDGADVRYDAFLAQFSLAQPLCAPLFGVRHYLISLMHKVDYEESGFVTLDEFAACCKAVKVHMGSAAPPLLLQTNRMLAALGPPGRAARKTRMVDIAEITTQFRVVSAVKPASRTSASGEAKGAPMRWLRAALRLCCCCSSLTAAEPNLKSTQLTTRRRIRSRAPSASTPKSKRKQSAVTTPAQQLSEGAGEGAQSGVELTPNHGVSPRASSSADHPRKSLISRASLTNNL
ncbi:hypothetical protein AB1Y20_017305 [Prymnesium parvum]|uniref:Serine/threonine-protein phosphatase n=1 Tax=Prymnesium parvum TaxID=97485 RepID=A0AB34JMP3_PRYPA